MNLSDVIRDSTIIKINGQNCMKMDIDQFNWLIDEFENIENQLYQTEVDLFEFKQKF